MNQAPRQQPSQGLAIASMVLGIVGIIFSWSLYAIPIPIVGLILAIIARRNGNTGGMATTGLVTSIIAIAIGGIVIIAIAGCFLCAVMIDGF